MSFKLYGSSSDPRVKKILIASKYSGINVELVETATSKQLPKSASFLRLPVLELADGSFLHNNGAAYYLANAQLEGSNKQDKAKVVCWASWSEEELNQPVATWMFPTLGYVEATRPMVERAKSDTKSALASLNSHLLNQTFLVGERVTLADISVCTILIPLFEHVADGKFRGDYSNVQRWFETCINQPQFKEVLGTVSLCQSTPAFKEGECLRSAPKKVEKKDEKKVEKKKEEKPKKEKKPEPEPMDDGDDFGIPQEKQKDPWAELPKGNFDMDDFKRYYSNNEEVKSIPYFWEKFDKQNYSIWYCEYKYPEELTLIFMSCNLMSGMMQRLDKMRKCAFGSLILFGEDHKSSISGVWVWRGQDLAFKLSPDWQVDYESYNWVKLDPDSEDTKKKVTEYFSWEGDFDGKKFNQGKIFK